MKPPGTQAPALILRLVTARGIDTAHNTGCGKSEQYSMR